MICELYNKMGRYITQTIFGDRLPRCETEVSLLAFILLLLFTIFVSIMFAWWVIPLRRVKFKCKNKKE